MLYSKTSQLNEVDEARMELFCNGDKRMANIPNTKGALLENSKRTAYQASVWTTSHRTSEEVPAPAGRGWTWDEKTNSWTPVWTTLPIAIAMHVQK